MKTLIIVLLSVVVWGAAAVAQPPAVAWSRVYGGTGFESMWAVIPATGGRYLVAGETSTIGAGSGDFWVILLDAAGDTIWTRTYGTPTYDGCAYAISTTDGGYALVGWRNWAFQDTSAEGWFLKLDANGDSLWSRTLNLPGCQEEPYWVEQTSDGGYIIAGYLYRAATANFDGWLVKLDAGGAVQWQRTYGGAGFDGIISLTIADDGGYALAGYTSSFGAGGTDGWLLKTNANGDSLWSQTYGTTADESFVTLSRNADNGFLLVGYQYDGDWPDYDWYLVKTSSTGTVLWEQEYGFAGVGDAPWQGQQTADGGFVVGGFFEYPDSGGIDLVGLKLDANGDSTWSFRFYGDGADYGWFAYTTPDGGFIFGADTYSSWSNGSADWLLVKTQTECDDPTPTAPEVVITTANSNAYLNWDPVTESVSGCPIFATHYLVFYKPTFAEPFYYHGYTTATTYTHWGFVAYAPGQFYNVIASTAPLPTLRELPNDGSLTQEDVTAFLTERGYSVEPVVLNLPDHSDRPAPQHRTPHSRMHRSPSR